MVDEILRNDLLRFPNIFESAFLADRISGHSFNTSVGIFIFDTAGEPVCWFEVQQLAASSGAFEVRAAAYRGLHESPNFERFPR